MAVTKSFQALLLFFQHIFGALLQKGLQFLTFRGQKKSQVAAVKNGSLESFNDHLATAIGSRQLIADNFRLCN